MLVTLGGQGLKLRNCLNVEPGNKLWSLTTERNNVCHYFLHSKNFVHLLKKKFIFSLQTLEIGKYLQ